MYILISLYQVNICAITTYVCIKKAARAQELPNPCDPFQTCPIPPSLLEVTSVLALGDSHSFSLQLATCNSLNIF